MTKIFWITLLIGSMMFASVSSATCVGGNSCWIIENNSAYAADINCVGYGDPEFFTKTGLEPGARFSMQYDEGFGDGLGYPEPHVWFSCFIEAGTKRAILNFSTIFWGDAVKFHINDTQVILRQESNGTSREQSVILK